MVAASKSRVRTDLKAGQGQATATLRVRHDGRDEPSSVAKDAVSALVQATAAAALSGDVEALSDLYMTFGRRTLQHPLTAEARVMPRQGTLRSCEVEVRDWNGELVAKALLSYRL